MDHEDQSPNPATFGHLLHLRHSFHCMLTTWWLHGIIRFTFQTNISVFLFYRHKLLVPKSAVKALTSSKQRSYCFLWLSFSIDRAEFSACRDKSHTDNLYEWQQLCMFLCRQWTYGYHKSKLLTLLMRKLLWCLQDFKSSQISLEACCEPICKGKRGPSFESELLAVCCRSFLPW